MPRNGSPRWPRRWSTPTRCGVIHRDVKPSNVLIDREDRVYLTDFGLAKSDAGEATLTIDGQVIGTPAYMAPEQAGETNEPVDARTDVYSLGVILYELLTGTRPFLGPSAMLLVRIREEEPRPPRRLDDTIPRDLETICLKCLRKAPRRAICHGRRAGRRHAPIPGGPADPGPADPAWERAVKWVRRRPAMAALVALCAASAFGLIGRLAMAGRSRTAARANDRRRPPGACRGARREARCTRRHLYAVEVDRAYDAWEHPMPSWPGRSSTDSGRAPARRTCAGSSGTISGGSATATSCFAAIEARVRDHRVLARRPGTATASNDHTIRLWKPSTGASWPL